MILKWESMYSVNVEEIDEQHKKLFGIVNFVYDLAEKKFTKKEALKIIEELKDYANYHFATEEKYFKEFNYPESAVHIAEHDGYRKKVLKIERDIKKSSGKKAYDELSDFLGDWWLGHVQSSDHEYSAFFNQHGLY